MNPHSGTPLPELKPELFRSPPCPAVNLRAFYWNLRTCIRQGRFDDALFEVLHALGLHRLDEIQHAVRLHRQRFGSWPRLFKPRRFRDKLLRLMLSGDGHSLLRAYTTDKAYAKSYVQAKLGEGFTPRTYALLKSKSEIRQFDFPEHCVIKGTHDSGSIFIRRNGEAVDIAKLESWLDRDYYRVFREPHYRLLHPKLIVEELLSSVNTTDLADYKIFCFSGFPAFIQVDTNRFSGHTRSFFSPRWNRLNFSMNFLSPDSVPAQPAGLPDMLLAARVLSADFSFLRVDFYQLDGRILIGELTSFPEGSHTKFYPDEADFLAGQLFQHPDADVETLFGLARHTREQA